MKDPQKIVELKKAGAGLVAIQAREVQAYLRRGFEFRDDDQKQVFESASGEVTPSKKTAKKKVGRRGG